MEYAFEFMGAVCVYVGGASILVTCMLLCWSITLSVADAMKGRSWQKKERGK